MQSIQSVVQKVNCYIRGQLEIQREILTKLKRRQIHHNSLRHPINMKLNPFYHHQNHIDEALILFSVPFPQSYSPFRY